MDLLPEVDSARSRLDPTHGQLEVARGEALGRHRAVIGNAVLVELVANQTQKVTFQRHWECSSVFLVGWGLSPPVFR